MRKVIIDCDTGIDDALAIAYLLANKDYELIGITTVFGNVDVDLASKNSLLLLELFKRDDIKVYKGASHALEKEEYYHNPRLDRIHGFNGIGNVDLGEPKGKIEDNACDFIIDSIKKYGKELDLIFVGPLTNLALCLKKDKEIFKSVNNITIMGGALTIQGNRDKYAEANISEDPLAAKYVFESEIDLNIIPLDATLKTLFKVIDIDEWKDINEAGKDLYDIARYYYVNEYRDENVGGAMHDPLAAFASFDQSIITNWYPCNLTVEDSGRTIGTLDRLNLNNKYHKVALDVDNKRFEKEYIETVSELIRKQN